MDQSRRADSPSAVGAGVLVLARLGRATAAGRLYQMGRGEAGAGLGRGRGVPASAQIHPNRHSGVAVAQCWSNAGRTLALISFPRVTTKLCFRPRLLKLVPNRSIPLS